MHHGGMAVRSLGAVEATLTEDASGWQRHVMRVRRHLHWAARDGVARLIEEDNLDPRTRLATALGRRRWRDSHGVQPGQARAVFVVGLQRSGTNMVLRGLQSSPAVEVHNENDREVFNRFLLRGDDVVRDVVMRSRHSVVLFKPLSDSHRTVHLLDGLGLLTAPRAIWVYRDVDGRARSAVAKFGDANRRVLAEIAEGGGLQRWQAQGLSEQSLELIGRCAPARLSPESAAALFWVVRNALFFDLGLHLRPDVHLVSYGQAVADPAAATRRIAAFAGLPWQAGLGRAIDQRSAGRPPMDIDPQVRSAADHLMARLAEVERQHAARPI